jgi:hypothetical protein
MQTIAERGLFADVVQTVVDANDARSAGSDKPTSMPSSSRLKPLTAFAVQKPAWQRRHAMHAAKLGHRHAAFGLAQNRLDLLVFIAISSCQLRRKFGS